MSRTPEQRLWDVLRPKLQAEQVRALRVENRMEDGFPDVFCQHMVGGITLLETKARPEAPKRITSLALGDKYGLRQSQKNWWLAFNWFNGAQQSARGLIVSRIGTGVWAHNAKLSDRINLMSFEEFCDEADERTAAGVARLVAREDWK